eukprot:8339674-Alexandrium_andersonii.AAC.1
MSGVHFVAKHHFAWYLAERAAWLGNPKAYWTYADEEENRCVSAVAKSLHGGSTFYTAFVQK